MPNILDENVVILRFDNSDFKKNTEDSIRSLENLKSSLRNSESGEKLSSLGNAAREIDLSGITKSIETVNSRFSTMGVIGMAAINKLTSAAMNSAASIIKAVPNQMVKGGWRRALNIEQAEFLMKGLGYTFDGTYDKATKMFTGIKGAVLSSVDDTAYGLDEAAKVAASFLASGVNGADELARRLKAVSGVAAVTSSDFSQIGRIFVQVAGQGRMMGDDLNQLSDKGFNAAQEITKYLNANRGVADSAMEASIAAGRQVKAMKEVQTHAKLTESDVREMVSAGAISFDIMANSLEHFFDTAQEANKTYTGSFANVKASLSRMGAMLEEPKLKNMTRIFNTLLPILKQLEDRIKPFTTALANASNKITDFINEGILNPLGEALGLDTTRFFHGFTDAVKEAGKEAKGAGKNTKDLGDKIRVTAQEWQAALDIWNKGTYGNGQRRADAIRELGMSYENVQGIINRFYKTGFDWEKTKENYIVGSEDEKKANNDVAKSADEVTDRLYQQTEQLSTLGRVILGVINFAKAFKNILTGVGNILKYVWNSSKKMVGLFGNAFSDTFLRISIIVKNISERFLELTKILNKDGLTSLKDKAPATYSALNLIKKGISAVVDVISSAYHTVSSFFQHFTRFPGMSKFKNSLGNVATKVTEKFSDAIDRVTSGFAELKDKYFGTGAGAIGAAIARSFSNAFEGLSNFLNALASGKTIAGSFMSAIGAIANKVIGLFQPVFSWLTDKFFSAIETIIEFFTKLGESEGIEKLKNTLTDLVSALVETEKPLGIVTGGIKDLSSATQTGGLEAVVNFFSNLAGGLADFINSVANGTNPIEKFIEVFKKVRDSVSLSGVVDYLKSTLGFATGQGIKYAINGLVDFVNKVSKWLEEIHALDKLTKTAHTIVDGIVGIFTSLVNYPWGKMLDKIAGYDWEKIGKIGMYFAGIFGIVKSAVDMGAVAKSAAGMFKSIGGMFSSFGSIADEIKKSIKMKSFETLAISIAILIGSIVALAMVPVDRLKPALAGVIAIMGALSGIMILMNQKWFDPAKLHAIGVAFAGVGAGVFLMATSMAIIARLKVGDIIKGGGVIVAFMLMMALISKNAKEMTGVGAAFLALALAVNLLVTAVMAFAMMPFAVIIKGGGTILAFMFLLASAARVANSSKPGGFLAMAVALNLLIPAIVMMALIPAHMIIKGGSAVVALIFALAKAAQIAGGKGFGDLSKVALVIGVLAAACLVLSFISPDRLLASATAISGMMIALGGAARLANNASLKSIFGMVAVIAALAGAIILLDKVSPERAVPIALSLSVLVGAISLAMFALGKLPGDIKAAAKAAASIDVFMGIIVGGVLAICSGLLGIKELIDASFGEGKGQEYFDAAIGVLGDIGAAIGTFFGRIKASFDEATGGEDTPGIVEKFKTLVESMSGMFESLSSIKTEDITKFVDFASSIKELSKADLMETISNVFGGSSMNIGDQMAAFAGSLTSFVGEIESLTDSDIEKAGLAAGIFSAFAKGMSDLPSTGGIFTVFSSKSIGGIFGFGGQMKSFGKSLSTFIGEMDDVDLEKLKAFITSGKLGLIETVVSRLANMNFQSYSVKAEVWDGFKSIAEFGKEMEGFGDSMGTFIGEMDDVGLDKLKGLVNSGKLSLIISICEQLNALQGALNPSGGITQAKEGNTTLAEFANDLTGPAGFCLGMDKLCSQLALIDPAELENTIAILPQISTVVTELTKLANGGIPKSGGWEQFVSGEEDLGAFGTKLGEFAKGFATFSQNAEGIDIATFDGKIEAIVDAAKALNTIEPPEVGLFEALAQWMTISIQYDGLKNLVGLIQYVAKVSVENNGDVSSKVQAISDASQKLGDIKPPSESFFGSLKKWAIVKVEKSSIKNLVDTINAMAAAGDTINVQGVSKINTAASAIEHGVKKIQGLGTVPSGSNLVVLSKNVAKFCNKMSSVNTDNIGTNVSAVSSSVKSLSSVVKNAGTSVGNTSSTLSSSGAKLSSGFAKGIKTGQKEVNRAAKSLADGAKKAIDGNALHSVGANLSKGLASGMRSCLGKVRAAADELERQAERAVRAKAKVKSPSRVFMRIGEYIGEGFAIGIQSYSNKVYKASNLLAQQSIDAANDAMGAFDTVTSPVITPVVDLTNVKRSAQSINAMMTSDQAIDVGASVNESTSNYETSAMMRKLISKLDDMTESKSSSIVGSNQVNMPINVQVDGARDPEEFTNQLVRSLRREMRTR